MQIRHLKAANTSDAGSERGLAATGVELAARAPNDDPVDVDQDLVVEQRARDVDGGFVERRQCRVVVT
jgi:hypothetical protein